MGTKLLNKAYILSLITIFYNLVEGGVATFYGAQDETLALFGFGLDSFVEVLSGLDPGQEYVYKNSYLIKADIEKSEAEHVH